MTFNSIIIVLTLIFFSMGSLRIVLVKLKKRKRSAESIYKLIDDLEKKYIY